MQTLLPSTAEATTSPSRLRNRWIGLAIFLSVACWLALDAFWITPDSLVTVRTRLELPNWPATPPGQSPITIAAISDLHIGSPFVGLEKLKLVVERTNAEHPDLVVLLGDFLIGGINGSPGVKGGHFVPAQPVAQELAKLRAPLGVIAVLGNHDWWVDGPGIEQALTQAGILVLSNQARHLQRGTQGFWLGGVMDYWTGSADVRRTLLQIAEHRSTDPVVLITHNPDVFQDTFLAPPVPVSLMIAGHTHGGQVDLPILGRLARTSQYGYVAGHIVDQGHHLFVTTGIGTSILPVRFRVPPQIDILELTGETDHSH